MILRDGLGLRDPSRVELDEADRELPYTTFEKEYNGLWLRVVGSARLRAEELSIFDPNTTLAPTAYCVLEVVSQTREKGALQTEIAKHLGIDARNLFHFMKTLVQNELVTRRSVNVLTGPSGKRQATTHIKLAKFTRLARLQNDGVDERMEGEKDDEDESDEENEKEDDADADGDGDGDDRMVSHANLAWLLCDKLAKTERVTLMQSQLRAYLTEKCLGGRKGSWHTVTKRLIAHGYIQHVDIGMKRDERLVYVRCVELVKRPNDRSELDAVFSRFSSYKTGGPGAGDAHLPLHRPNLEHSLDYQLYKILQDAGEQGIIQSHIKFVGVRQKAISKRLDLMKKEKLITATSFADGKARTSRLKLAKFALSKTEEESVRNLPTPAKRNKSSSTPIKTENLSSLSATPPSQTPTSSHTSVITPKKTSTTPKKTSTASASTKSTNVEEIDSDDDYGAGLGDSQNMQPDISITSPSVSGFAGAKHRTKVKTMKYHSRRELVLSWLQEDKVLIISSLVTRINKYEMNANNNGSESNTAPKNKVDKKWVDVLIDLDLIPNNLACRITTSISLEGKHRPVSFICSPESNNPSIWFPIINEKAPDEVFHHHGVANFPVPAPVVAKRDDFATLDELDTTGRIIPGVPGKVVLSNRRFRTRSAADEEIVIDSSDESEEEELDHVSEAEESVSEEESEGEVQHMDTEDEEREIARRKKAAELRKEERAQRAKQKLETRAAASAARKAAANAAKRATKIANRNSQQMEGFSDYEDDGDEENENPNLQGKNARSSDTSRVTTRSDMAEADRAEDGEAITRFRRARDRGLESSKLARARALHSWLCHTLFDLKCGITELVPNNVPRVIRTAQLAAEMRARSESRNANIAAEGEDGNESRSNARANGEEPEGNETNANASGDEAVETEGGDNERRPNLTTRKPSSETSHPTGNRLLSALMSSVVSISRLDPATLAPGAKTTYPSSEADPKSGAIATQTAAADLDALYTVPEMIDMREAQRRWFKGPTFAFDEKLLPQMPLYIYLKTIGVDFDLPGVANLEESTELLISELPAEAQKRLLDGKYYFRHFTLLREVLKELNLIYPEMVISEVDVTPRYVLNPVAIVWRRDIIFPDSPISSGAEDLTIHQLAITVSTSNTDEQASAAADDAIAKTTTSKGRRGASSSNSAASSSDTTSQDFKFIGFPGACIDFWDTLKEQSDILRKQEERKKLYESARRVASANAKSSDPSSMDNDASGAASASVPTNPNVTPKLRAFPARPGLPEVCLNSRSWNSRSNSADSETLKSFWSNVLVELEQLGCQPTDDELPTTETMRRAEFAAELKPGTAVKFYHRYWRKMVETKEKKEERRKRRVEARRRSRALPDSSSDSWEEDPEIARLKRQKTVDDERARNKAEAITFESAVRASVPKHTSRNNAENIENGSASLNTNESAAGGATDAGEYEGGRKRRSVKRLMDHHIDQLIKLFIEQKASKGLYLDHFDSVLEGIDRAELARKLDFPWEVLETALVERVSTTAKLKDVASRIQAMAHKLEAQGKKIVSAPPPEARPHLLASTSQFRQIFDIYYSQSHKSPLAAPDNRRSIESSFSGVTAKLGFTSMSYDYFKVLPPSEIHAMKLLQAASMLVGGGNGNSTSNPSPASVWMIPNPYDAIIGDYAKTLFPSSADIANAQTTDTNAVIVRLLSRAPESNDSVLISLQIRKFITASDKKPKMAVAWTWWFRAADEALEFAKKTRSSMKTLQVEPSSPESAIPQTPSTVEGGNTHGYAARFSVDATGDARASSENDPLALTIPTFPVEPFLSGEKVAAILHLAEAENISMDIDVGEIGAVSRISRRVYANPTKLSKGRAKIAASVSAASSSTNPKATSAVKTSNMGAKEEELSPDQIEATSSDTNAAKPASIGVVRGDADNTSLTLAWWTEMDALNRYSSQNALTMAIDAASGIELAPSSESGASLPLYEIPPPTYESGTGRIEEDEEEPEASKNSGKVSKNRRNAAKSREVSVGIFSDQFRVPMRLTEQICSAVLAVVELSGTTAIETTTLMSQLIDHGEIDFVLLEGDVKYPTTGSITIVRDALTILAGMRHIVRVLGEFEEAWVSEKNSDPWTVEAKIIESNRAEEDLEDQGISSSARISYQPWIHLNGQVDPIMRDRLRAHVYLIVRNAPGITEEAVLDAALELFRPAVFREIIELLITEEILYCEYLAWTLPHGSVFDRLKAKQSQETRKTDEFEYKEYLFTKARHVRESAPEPSICVARCLFVTKNAHINL